jgi:hypothetical protein
MIAALSLSLVVAAVAVVGWIRARGRARSIARRYVEALAVLTYVARADPAASPTARRSCERLLAAHRVDMRIAPTPADLDAMYDRP